MRAAVIVLVLLAGCAGLDRPERGGWSVFRETCSECAELVFSTRSGVFDMSETFALVPPARLFAYYESPIEVGTHVELRWTTPIFPTIETRRAIDSTSYAIDEHVCVSDQATPTPTPTAPTPFGAPLGPGRDCVLDLVTQTRLEAPRNGITILWEIERATGTGNATFTARTFPPRTP